MHRSPHTPEARRKMVLAMQARLKGGWKPTNAQTRIYREAICEQCGQTFRFRYFPSSKRRRKYCTRKCYELSISARQARPAPTFDFLYQLYWVEEVGTTRIAKSLRCSQTQVTNWMKRLGIPLRKQRHRIRKKICVVKGCGLRVHDMLHSMNGCRYGRRCLFHQTLHLRRNGELYRAKMRNYRLSDLMAAVNAISERLPIQFRDDICQQIIVDCLEHRLTVSEIASAVPRYVNHHYREYQSQNRFGTLSLNAPIGDGSFTLGDRLGI